MHVFFLTLLRKLNHRLQCSTMQKCCQVYCLYQSITQVGRCLCAQLGIFSLVSVCAEHEIFIGICVRSTRNLLIVQLSRYWQQNIQYQSIVHGSEWSAGGFCRIVQEPVEEVEKLCQYFPMHSETGCSKII